MASLLWVWNKVGKVVFGGVVLPDRRGGVGFTATVAGISDQERGKGEGVIYAAEEMRVFMLCSRDPLNRGRGGERRENGVFFA
ncbi:hypothetical protein Hanom_Chr01g00049481 [Helianthus anomalus]